MYILQFFVYFYTTHGSTHPSIIWNPWNPLFACSLPRINVWIGDTVNFVCPTEEHTFYMPTASVTLPRENLYFLGTDEHAYHTCDARGKKKLLHCNASGPIHKTITFRDFHITRESIIFSRNTTYYFIGTGFRKKENLNNEVNGSCSKTDQRGPFKLRLQVHVCDDEDTDCRFCNRGVTCPNTQCTPPRSHSEIPKSKRTKIQTFLETSTRSHSEIPTEIPKSKATRIQSFFETIAAYIIG